MSKRSLLNLIEIKVLRSVAVQHNLGRLLKGTCRLVAFDVFGELTDRTAQETH